KYQYEINFPSPAPKYPRCQQSIYPSLQRKAAENETVLCGRNTVQIHQKSNMDLKKSEKKLARVAKTHLTPFLLKVQFNNEINFVIFPDGRVLIQGTEDTTKARNWYDRYIGS